MVSVELPAAVGWSREDIELSVAVILTDNTGQCSVYSGQLWKMFQWLFDPILISSFFCFEHVV
jgi:hypothetical protein